MGELHVVAKMLRLGRRRVLTVLGVLLLCSFYTYRWIPFFPYTLLYINHWTSTLPYVYHHDALLLSSTASWCDCPPNQPVNNHHPETVPKVNAAIVYLCGDASRTDELLVSLDFLYRNFASGFPQYPILVFYQRSLLFDSQINILLELINAQRLRYRYAEETSRHPETLPTMNITFVATELNVPSGFSPEALKEPPVLYDRYPGYHTMIQFWFEQIFHEPAMDPFDYYWRLDTDSFLLSPFMYDPFVEMARRNLKYGYIQTSGDPPKVTQNLWTFLNDYVTSSAHSLDILLHLQQHRVGLPSPSNKDSSENIQIYYNNFEILHLPTWRTHRGIQEWTRQVHESFGIFQYRWGDAPLRFYTVAMFLAPEEVHWFCDVAYNHQHVHLRAVNEAAGVCTPSSP
jgi:mannosyltransferase